MTSKCPHCDDVGWVCENHPEIPATLHQHCGPGIPCVCNPEGKPPPDHLSLTGTYRIPISPAQDGQD